MRLLATAIVALAVLASSVTALRCPPGFVQRRGAKFCDEMEPTQLGPQLGPQPWFADPEEGAVPLADGGFYTAGTQFRVWAPHATACYVVGDFGQSRMQPDSTQGYWVAQFGGAVPGQK
jgi:hypothetical protein